VKRRTFDAFYASRFTFATVRALSQRYRSAYGMHLFVGRGPVGKIESVASLNGIR